MNNQLLRRVVRAALEPGRDSRELLLSAGTDIRGLNWKTDCRSPDPSLPYPCISYARQWIDVCFPEREKHGGCAHGLLCVL
jgi:hypothetical protein